MIEKINKLLVGVGNGQVKNKWVKMCCALYSNSNIKLQEWCPNFYCIHKVQCMLLR